MSESPETRAESSPPAHAVKPSEAPDTARRERRGPPPNPLYHPLFLPILLTLFSLWFGWDGFFTTDPEMLEHRTFNQVMFFLILPICAFAVPRGIKEFHEEQGKSKTAAAAD